MTAKTADSPLPRIVDVVVGDRLRGAGSGRAWAFALAVALHLLAAFAVSRLTPDHPPPEVQPRVQVSLRAPVPPPPTPAPPAAVPPPAIAEPATAQPAAPPVPPPPSTRPPAAAARASRKVALGPQGTLATTAGAGPNVAGDGAATAAGSETGAGAVDAPPLPTPPPPPPPPPAPAPPPARDRSRPVSLDPESWSCAWPSEADPDEVSDTTVVLRVTVSAAGVVDKVAIVRDPGHGLGAAARACAKGIRFNPARDPAGQPTAAESPPIRVRFVP